MATKEHFTDDAVPLSTRQAIIERYDTNGDGKYDTNEINNIIDDFASMTQVNKSLADTYSQMKKTIIGAFSLIVVLSISNFGTALLAMNMSKEVVVVDGKIMANGGSQEEAVSTMTSIRTLKKEFPDTQYHQDRHRRILQGDILSQGVQGNDTPPTEDVNEEEVICFTSNEVNDLLESTIDGSGTNIVLVGTATENDSGSLTVIPINGGVHDLEGDEGGYIFSNVQFVPVDSTERCIGETHRNLAHSDRRGDSRKIPSKGRGLQNEGNEPLVYEIRPLPYSISVNRVIRLFDSGIYESFDFGESGTIKGIKIRYNNSTPNPHMVQIRLGSSGTGELIAEFFPVVNADFGEYFTAYVGLLNADVAGVHELTLSYNWNDKIRFGTIELSDFADRTVVHAKIMATQISSGKGIFTTESYIGRRCFAVHDRYFATYSQVNFGEPGTTEGILLRYSLTGDPDTVTQLCSFSRGARASIAVRLGGIDGRVIATFAPPLLHGQLWSHGFETAYVSIEGVAGIHDLTIGFFPAENMLFTLESFQLIGTLPVKTCAVVQELLNFRKI